MEAVVIRLFVGSDPAQHLAERALEASVRANTTQPVEITWMRAGDPGFQSGEDWATPFSMFRWWVPELCNYEGRAIYMDCDMLVLRDLAELWDRPLESGLAGAFAGRSCSKADVILWQCENVPKWDRDDPKLRRLGGRSLVGSRLPAYWDHMDQVHPDTGILHFTKMSWQPWHPYKHKYPYDQPHPDPAAEALFWKYAG